MDEGKVSEEMKDWKIVKSKSGVCKDGFPLGEFLCRRPEDIEHAIRGSGMTDPIILPYKERKDGRS